MQLHLFLKPFLINPSLIGNLTFIFGAFLLFRCFITSGADPLTFSYYRNGNLTQSSSNVKTETNYKFTFLGLQKIRKSMALNTFSKLQIDMEKIALHLSLMLMVSFSFNEWRFVAYTGKNKFNNL